MAQKGAPLLYEQYFGFQTGSTVKAASKNLFVCELRDNLKRQAKKGSI